MKRYMVWAVASKGKGCFHSPVTRRLAPNSNADKPSDTHSQTPRRYYHRPLIYIRNVAHELLANYWFGTLCCEPHHHRSDHRYLGTELGSVNININPSAHCSFTPHPACILSWTESFPSFVILLPSFPHESGLAVLYSVLRLQSQRFYLSYLFPFPLSGLYSVYSFSTPTSVITCQINPSK